MKELYDSLNESLQSFNTLMDSFWDQQEKMLNSSADMFQIGNDYLSTLSKYQSDFLVPLCKAMGYFYQVEQDKFLTTPPLETTREYMELLRFNLDIAHAALLGSLEVAFDYHHLEYKKNLCLWLDRCSGGNGDGNILDLISNKAEIMKGIAHDFPQAIQDIRSEYGYHFEQGGYVKLDETDRYCLYQVLPSEKGVQVRDEGKPILIVHPYVLGADILAFLPGENKSYVHAFANQGIPTFVRILKDIETNPAVQSITLEDDILDTKRFCSVIREKHTQPITLNGYCQGGLVTLANILSGEVDGLVDAHITCVAPLDGTRSEGLGGFLQRLPARFNSLEYGMKILPSGNRVADGDLMSWVYKVKSISDEAPVISFYRDLSMFKMIQQKDGKLSKTVAALIYWLNYQRHDLPLEITKLSFASYSRPITKEGELPFTAFGRPLNLHDIEKKKVPWLICYGQSDALVEKETALAPLDFIQAEVSPFPKGHVAIATSWSHPASEYALHTRFGDKEQYRGPVRFQLDLEQEKMEREAS